MTHPSCRRFPDSDCLLCGRRPDEVCALEEAAPFDGTPIGAVTTGGACDPEDGVCEACQ